MFRIEQHRKRAATSRIEQLSLPPQVFIPLSQHIGKICSPVVKVGDVVTTGSLIGKVESHVWAPVHASIAGRVSGIQEWPHPLIGRSKAVVIDNDGSDKKEYSGRDDSQINSLTPQKIRDIVFSAGITGMGGAGFPTHIKLNPPKPLDTLILNGAECEPELSADYRLMIEKTDEILKGAELIAKAAGAKNVYIAIEDNKPEAIAQFQKRASWFTVKILPSAYPQGGERQLIKSILGREVPSGKLPFEVAVLVQNVATVFAVYEAVYLGKPLYERVVTVTGGCISHPKNLLVRIGTPIKELISFCGELKEEPAKIILGGPMMGIAQYTTDVPITKTTSGVLLLNKKESVIEEEEFCIRCGACIRSCPAGLMPCLINLASEKAMWSAARAYNALDCIECGLCNYVCPAKRRLTQSIKRAKLEVSK
ncbi:MAG: electron transport complex subunit RsxC [Candidatus Omnitrophica bacterium]|nr:electron transport complex subunit RsxC [Candidatus Omnitrophota bacterium]